MISITKATVNDFELLSHLGRKSFLQSHGRSAAPADIDRYVARKFSPEAVKDELSNEKNIFHIIYQSGTPAGYSKIIFNSPDANIELPNVTKLERLYLLEQFFGQKLGLNLFEFNLQLSKKNKQTAMWLFVWKENHQAINFYTKNGFEIVGSYDFKITDTHSNPNHQMILRY